MKFVSTLSISLFLRFTVAGFFHIGNLRHDIVDKGGTEATLLARQEEPMPTTSSSTTTSTIGILPPLGTGTPSNGGISLTGHGPAIQPQPGDSNAGADTDTDTITSSNTDTGAGTGTGIDTSTSPNSNYTNPSNSSDVTHPGYSPNHLEVTDYQYTMNGRPHVEIQVKYGSRNITQTWEVRNGTLHQVHDKSSKPCGSSSAYIPAGTGTPDDVRGGEGFSESTNSTGESMGVSGEAMGRPNAAKPGFTGPKFMARRRGEQNGERGRWA
ncbi:MAG: hypothetical protein LQ343_000411 [Gyalolechia ehrenbergii]|nr:MAG: hypothetical protein LQ343_000411 [Gyalolechia ehrenbergii]